MSLKSFRGGVHPKGNKELSAESPLRTYLPKGELVFPLSQHIGRPAAPVVKKGDEVLVGQLIAAADGFISANIVSSCSGKVKAVDARFNANGTVETCIVIDNDGQFNTIEGFGTPSDYTAMTGEEIIAKVKAAGIIGLGGAGFPTHVKLMPKNPEAIDYIIANGAECEPYITCDDRLMREHPDWIIGGMKVVLKLFPQAKGVIGIEHNKPEAIASMQKACENEPAITVEPLKTKYPQGGERSLITAITGRKLAAAELPAAKGCIVDNVATLAAIYQAVCLNTPLVEKGFTVTGDAITEPCNLMVRIGTSISELVEAAGGLNCEPQKVILGGPMTGPAITALDRPIVKANGALVCMKEDPIVKAAEQQTACIRCGKCIRVCPLGLSPQLMAEAAQRGNYERYEKLSGLSCVACGACTYTCPAKRPLMQLFKVAKSAIMAEKAKGAKK